MDRFRAFSANARWRLFVNDQQDIIDLGALIADLRLAVRYAARMGVLKDRAMIQTLEDAEQAIAAEQKPDAFAVTSALNEIAALIAPMTIADLCLERDPFLPKNRRKSSFMRMGLIIFALIVLAAIGDSMFSLQREQEALTSLEKINHLEQQQKLSELRRFAQWDEPLALPRTPRSLNDQYHQKVAELMLINSTLAATVSRRGTLPPSRYGRSCDRCHRRMRISLRRRQRWRRHRLLPMTRRRSTCAARRRTENCACPPERRNTLNG